MIRGGSRITALLVLGLLLPTGCVQRTISVTSRPSGALVFLNDEEVGRSPVTVPHLFYGTYDVRLEREPVWYAADEAAQLLGLSMSKLNHLIASAEIESREEDGQQIVRVAFGPLWTSRKAEAPWWEAPGPDLVAEALPGVKVRQQWHFELKPVADVDEDALARRAWEMRAALENEFP